MPHRRLRLVRCWLLLMPLCVAYSLIVPLMGAVDEPAQMYWAAAVWRGEVGHRLVTLPGLGQENAVRVPPRLAALQDYGNCYPRLHDTPECAREPAAAGPVPGPHLDDSNAITQFGRYPPAYQLLVGWPTLFTDGTTAAYAIRLCGALAVSLMLALGLWVLARHHPRRSTVLGWALACTPAVFYFGGVSNASGLEISAAIAAWAALVTLTTSDEPHPQVAWVAGGTLAVLAVSRPVSPVFVVLAVVVCAVAADRPRVRALARARALRRPMALVVGALVAAGGWRLAVGAPTLLGYPSPGHPSKVEELQTIIGLSGRRAFSSVGDVSNLLPPVADELLWLGGGAVLLVLSGLAASRPALRGLGLLAAACLVIPVAGELAKFDQIGTWWQARYSLPMLVGLPILASANLPDLSALIPQVRQRASALLPALFTSAQTLMLVVVVHRYANGLDGPWLTTHWRWAPPGGLVIDAAMIVSAAIGLALALTLALDDRPRPRLARSGELSAWGPAVGPVAGPAGSGPGRGSAGSPDRHGR